MSSQEKDLITLFRLDKNFVFFKVNRILSRKKKPQKNLQNLHFIAEHTASSTSITKFIEFGKGHQKSRLTEKASKTTWLFSRMEAQNK